MNRKKKQIFKNPRFQKDWERFNLWIEKRRLNGELSDNSYSSQRSIVKRWLMELEENGVQDYEEGFKLFPPKKKAVAKKFLDVAGAYSLLGEEISFSFRGKRIKGLVKDVLFYKGNVFLLTKILSGKNRNQLLIIIPYSFVK